MNFDKDVINANGVPAVLLPGAVTMDSVQSFSLIHSGRLSATILGAMQVDEKGNMANWSIPGKRVMGMGGAMDLVVGAKRVLIAMEHCNKDGSPKILNQCTYPLTARSVVSYIITELCIIEVVPEGLKLISLAPWGNG